MFQLHDDHPGEPREVQPGQPGQLWLYLATTATGAGGDASAGGGAGADELRACLVADLVRRVAEQHHLRVSAWAAAAQPEVWDAMNVYPLEPSAEVPEPLDVGIVPATANPVPPGDAAGARWLRPGPLATSAGLSPDRLREAGIDPLALRLAILDQHYRRPLELSQAGLAASDAELRSWREQVADWARSPSKPMCAEYLQDFLTAFDRDLDTAAALTTLRALAADSAIPAGSKFETFAYADRLAGLDLARDVGRA